VPYAGKWKTACIEPDREVNVQLLIVSATLAGSIGAAWVIQRAILEVYIKAIDPHRR